MHGHPFRRMRPASFCGVRSSGRNSSAPKPLLVSQRERASVPSGVVVDTPRYGDVARELSGLWRASDAKGGVGQGLEPLEGDGLATEGADAEVGLVDPIEGVAEAVEFGLLTPLQLEGHLLALHRIHARKASNRNVRFHRLRLLVALRECGFQGLDSRLDRGLQF